MIIRVPTSTPSRPFTFGSVCSGIEAATVAWGPLGWRTAFLSEVNPFCRKVLQHYYPDVPNFGDLTQIPHRRTLLRYAYDQHIDLLCGGTPCQDFSVAGTRSGIHGSRSSLALGFIELLRILKPRWVLWENVPGVLSSWSDVQTEEKTETRRSRPRTYGHDVADFEQSDFDLFLSLLADLGYGIAYRVLDAQYAGLAQRRERVFVVGYLGDEQGDGRGDWRPAAAVLFDEESVRGDYQASGQKRQDVAPTLANRVRGGGGLGTDFDCDGGLVAYGGSNTSGPIDVATACNAEGGSGRMDSESETFVTQAVRTDVAQVARVAQVTHTLSADGFDASEDGTGIGESGDPMFTLQRGKQHAVAVSLRGRDGGSTAELGDEISNALRSSTGGGDKAHVLAQVSPVHTSAMAVRRLTPRECCRLMGFPDDYLLIPTYRVRQRETGRAAEQLYSYYCRTARGRLYTTFHDGRVYATPDGPMYKALGNSWAVPEIRHLGSRIELIDSMLHGKRDNNNAKVRSKVCV